MTMLRLNRAHVSWPLGLVLYGLLLLTHPSGAQAQSIVVMVNGEPVTSYDLAQRQRFLALTSGLGDKMKAKLQSDSTKAAFREYMMKNRPQSQEEAQALQKKFVAQLQQNVVAEASGGSRKAALDQLIDEKLMLQAARDQKITVTDAEVDEMLTRMAQGGQQKLSLQAFLAQFSSQGISPSTLRQKIKAQNAWRQVIRQVYGSRVSGSVSTTSATVESDENTTVDVQVVRFAVANAGDQKALGSRLVEAKSVQGRFQGCAQLAALLKGVPNVSIKTRSKVKLSEFGEVRAAIQKAEVGQMIPPTINGNAVEAYAICGKAVSVASGQAKKKDDPQEKLQEEFSLYSRRHLKDLKDRARLEYLKNS